MLPILQFSNICMWVRSLWCHGVCIFTNALPWDKLVEYRQVMMMIQPRVALVMVGQAQPLPWLKRDTLAQQTWEYVPFAIKISSPSPTNQQKLGLGLSRGGKKNLNPLAHPNLSTNCLPKLTYLINGQMGASPIRPN